MNHSTSLQPFMLQLQLLQVLGALKLLLLLSDSKGNATPNMAVSYTVDNLVKKNIHCQNIQHFHITNTLPHAVWADLTFRVVHTHGDKPPLLVHDVMLTWMFLCVCVCAAVTAGEHGVKHLQVFFTQVTCLLYRRCERNVKSVRARIKERRRQRADCVHMPSHLQQVLVGTRCCEATDSFMLSKCCFPWRVDSYLDWVGAAFRRQ